MPIERLFARAVPAAGLVTLALLAAETGQPERLSGAWPQFGGPTRDFRAPDGVALAARWPAQGPPRVWDRPLGEGYSGVVGDDMRLFTMFRRSDREIVIALDAATGRTLWERDNPAPALEQQDLSQGPGPHATPLITGSVVCTAGVTGLLQCLDRTTGEVRWRRELIQDLGGTPVYRGYSSSPLAWRDLVIAPVGGEGRGLMAFHRDDGREVWRAGTFHNTNGSPIVIEAAGRHQVMAFSHEGLAAFDPSDGEPLWTHAHPQRFNDNISLPLADGGRVFCTSALDGGARLIEITSGGKGLTARELWHQPRFGVYFTNVLWIDGYVYGSSGGVGPTFFSALDARTGELLWQDREIPRAGLLHAGGRTVALTETGELLLARLSPEGVEVLSRAAVLGEGPPAPMALMGTQLVVRDRSRIVALELGGESGR